MILCVANSGVVYCPDRTLQQVPKAWVPESVRQIMAHGSLSRDGSRQLTHGIRDVAGEAVDGSIGF